MTRELTRESGQAAVETALTMPLMLFIIMLVLQMGMLMQARNLTQYAVFRATRAGSVNHGACEPMMHAAVASLIPSFVSFAGGITGAGTLGSKLGRAFQRVMPLSVAPYTARFDPGMTGGQAAGYTESILWMVKERPLFADFGAWDLNNGEFSDWDQGDGVRGNNNPVRLEVRVVYWYPLRLPFIDWVMSRMMLAHWGLQAYDAVTPYMPVRTAAGAGAPAWNYNPYRAFGGDFLEVAITNELQRRHAMRQYSFPISAHYRMRFMTPPRIANFATPLCGFP